MKTEQQIVGELGAWLCRDMEKDLARTAGHLMSTERARGLEVIADMAKRINFYKDNCLRPPPTGVPGRSRTCGGCVFYVSDECDGKFEGRERYQDSEACGGFEALA